MKKKDKGKVIYDACVIERGGDSSDSEFCLVGHQTIEFDEWILDSGCTYHMCAYKKWFFNFEEVDGGTVYMGSGDVSYITRMGSIRLRNYDGSTRVLTDVRYVPKLKKNLISLGALESKGLVVIIRDGVLKVISGALMVIKGTRRNNLYYYNGSTMTGVVTTVFGSDKNSKIPSLLHRRLGHVGERALLILVKRGLLEVPKTYKLEFCEHCVMGKQRKVKFGTSIHHTKGILDYVHPDVWGPTKSASMGGRNYFVTFVEDFSRRTWAYVMKSKSGVFNVFLKWKNMAETQTRKKIKHLITNNGGEFCNDQFLKLCQDEGIVHHFTIRDTPQQNGVAKRMNQTLLEKVRCMLSNAGLGKEFWGCDLCMSSHQSPTFNCY